MAFEAPRTQGPEKLRRVGWDFAELGGQGGDAGFVVFNFGVGRLQAGDGAGGWLQAPAKFANISSLQMS